MSAETLDRLCEGWVPGGPDMQRIVGDMMQGRWPSAQTAALLALLRRNGETAAQLAGAAAAMRAAATPISFASQHLAVDTCGTGGDGKGWLNISTTAALVVAAMGVPVLKHGNRAQSSRSGSADVLAALGVTIDLTAPQVVRCVEACGLGFAFAPAFHGATKHVAPVRREMAIRTLFNLLGPLTNPAAVPYQVVGVFAPRWLDLVADALVLLGVTRAYVISGHDASDEIAVDGATHARLVEHGQVATLTLAPEQFGLSPVAASGLAGGDAAYNAQALTALLGMGETCPDELRAYFHATAMTAALAYAVATGQRDLVAATSLATRAICGGDARRVLDALIATSREVAA
ncbi:MAG: anthranilate phosphoribosyltransferase [Myxococcales bacterium]|nr:anthranilate phosphoribosyltransferase [Myxococcales bacterium]